MAMQVGMGLSRIVLLVGAGVTGSIVLRNGRLSEILAEIQELLPKVDKGDGSADVNEALAAQVRRLAMEVRQLGNNRSITVLNGGGGSGQGLTALIIPAAALGALGYGYMWWKGISFPDLMYVTKKNMATAVSSMTKHLDQVSASLAAAKKHLTQRIQGLDDKVTDQSKQLGKITEEVADARLKLVNIGSEMSNMKQLVFDLNGKMDSMEIKQGYACAGVMYLCNFVGGKGGKMPELLQDELKLASKRFITNGEAGNGLQTLLLAVDDKTKTDTGDIQSLDKLQRSASMKAIL